MVVEAFCVHFHGCFCSGVQVGSEGKAQGHSHSCGCMAVDSRLAEFNVQGKRVGSGRIFGGGSPVEIIPFSGYLFC